MPEQFTPEYDRLKAGMATPPTGAAPAAEETQLLADLKAILADEGFDPGQAGALDTLRKRAEGGPERILSLAGSDGGSEARVAALKTLQHTYLLSKFGGHDCWAVSLPKAFRAYATKELKALGAVTLKSRLSDRLQYHSETDMRNLRSATQKAMAWSQKASVVCGDISAGSRGRALIERWFGDEDTDDAALATMAARLRTGFQAITNACAGGRLILTDDPTVRGDASWEGSEAYVWPLGSAERLKVIYIEGAFFGTSNTLSGPTNWARILIHELSHSQVGTEDVVVPGDVDSRYSWHPQGIKPRKASFTSAMAMNNADSWAFFAVDAAGMLTNAERLTALDPKP